MRLSHQTYYDTPAPPGVSPGFLLRQPSGSSDQKELSAGGETKEFAAGGREFTGGREEFTSGKRRQMHGMPAMLLHAALRAVAGRDERYRQILFGPFMEAAQRQIKSRPAATAPEQEQEQRKQATAVSFDGASAAPEPLPPGPLVDDPSEHLVEDRTSSGGIPCWTTPFQPLPSS
eukprot:4683869-Pyramimonas_sp.AAC.1